jgi:glycosyltransferase involved in cell wall biosynthesis/rhamnogalacturonyl hydrolase YesR
MIAYSYYESDTRVIREAEAAVEGGFDVDFLALRKPGTPQIEVIRGVRVVRLNQAKYRGGGRIQYVAEYLKFFVGCLVKSARLFAEKRYGVIHVNNMPDFLVFSTLIPRLLGAKVILDIHDPMPNTFASKFKEGDGGFFYRLLLWQERLSAAYSNRVITVHDPVKEGILVKHGLAPESIGVIANFADEQLFRLRPAPPVRDKIRFVFHGTILERSGLRGLITSLSLIRHRDRVTVKIIGEGDFSEELKGLIASLGVGDVVEFDNRSHPAHSIPEQLADCHVGLVPLEISSVTNYALPLKLIEYISLGLPVVSVRSYAISFYFAEEDCMFFDWDQPASLAAVMDRIVERPELLDHYRGRSIALRKKFSWGSEKEKYISMLRELTGTTTVLNDRGEVGSLVRKSADAVARWVEEHNYKAYDPGDGNLSFLRHATFNRHFSRRLLTAVVLRTPFHIRPLIGIRPHTSTKGMGYMAWGYTKMYALTGSEHYRQRAQHCLQWLMENRSAGWREYCWGNHFAFSTRAGTIPAHTPTIVWSSLIGMSFVEAYKVFGDSKYLDAAASTAEWVKTLPREVTNRGTCLSYVPLFQSSIHNSNMLGAALLAQVAEYTKDQESLDLAKEAMRYSCVRQNEDGAWFYGEATKYHWIDNFHTGYNLDCLKRYQTATGDADFEPQLRRGFEYFKAHFFEQDGLPKYFHDKADPIDIQCAAQAIDTLAFFSDRDPDALELSGRVADWTIRNMQDPDGHFYYRDLGWKKIKTPMLHWGQGTTFKALAHLLTARAAAGDEKRSSLLGVGTGTA